MAETKVNTEFKFRFFRTNKGYHFTVMTKDRKVVYISKHYKTKFFGNFAYVRFIKDKEKLEKIYIEYLQNMPKRITSISQTGITNKTFKYVE